LAYDKRVDRLNAIRLLQALVAAGANANAPMTDAWIRKVALKIGLQNGALYSALAYAGTQDWLANNQKEGWTSLTRTGGSLGFTRLNHQNRNAPTTTTYKIISFIWLSPLAV
jgi:hypothetical protein